MSKGMLGSIRRALLKVPPNYRGLVLDVVHKLGGEDVDLRTDGWGILFVNTLASAVRIFILASDGEVWGAIPLKKK